MMPIKFPFSFINVNIILSRYCRYYKVKVSYFENLYKRALKVSVNS